MMINNRSLSVFAIMLIAPTITLIGSLLNNHFSVVLIDSRIQSLFTRGEIISAAISSDAKYHANEIMLNPEQLSSTLQNQKTETQPVKNYSAEFSMNPERIRPLLRRLINEGQPIARIYDKDGYILVDSRSPGGLSNILKYDQPDIQSKSINSDNVLQTTNIISAWIPSLHRHPYAKYRDIADKNGKIYPEVDYALQGHSSAIVRVDEVGRTVISVALPIKRQRYVRGALLLSQISDDIDSLERGWDINSIVYYFIAIMLSVIATPIILKLKI
jgi:two-component system, OmpR family, sensor histidine kinase ChvG